MIVRETRRDPTYRALLTQQLSRYLSILYLEQQLISSFIVISQRLISGACVFLLHLAELNNKKGG